MYHLEDFFILTFYLFRRLLRRSGRIHFVLFPREMSEVAEVERFACPRGDRKQAPQSQLFSKVDVAVFKPADEDREEPDGRAVE